MTMRIPAVHCRRFAASIAAIFNGLAPAPSKERYSVASSRKCQKEHKLHRTIGPSAGRQ
jgi:hypothetical protein